MLWEELKTELEKGKESDIYFQHLLENQKLEEKYPELYKLVDKPEIEKYHPSKNSFKHTMIALKRVQDESDLIKFAVLCHDLGKGETPNEILPHHYAHEQRGLKVIDRLCERISVPKEYKEFAKLFCKQHMKIPKMLVMGISKKFDLVCEISDEFSDKNKLIDILKCFYADWKGEEEDTDYNSLEEYSNICEEIISIFEIVNLIMVDSLPRTLRRVIQSSPLKYNKQMREYMLNLLKNRN